MEQAENKTPMKKRKPKRKKTAPEEGRRPLDPQEPPEVLPCQRLQLLPGTPHAHHRHLTGTTLAQHNLRTADVGGMWRSQGQVLQQCSAVARQDCW